MHAIEDDEAVVRGGRLNDIAIAIANSLQDHGFPASYGDAVVGRSGSITPHDDANSSQDRHRRTSFDCVLPVYLVVEALEQLDICPRLQGVAPSFAFAAPCVG